MRTAEGRPYVQRRIALEHDGGLVESWSLLTEEDASVVGALVPGLLAEACARFVIARRVG